MMDVTYNFEKYLQLAENTYFERLGKVVKIVALFYHQTEYGTHVPQLSQLHLKASAPILSFRGHAL